MRGHILNKGYDFCRKEHFSTISWWETWYIAVLHICLWYHWPAVCSKGFTECLVLMFNNTWRDNGFDTTAEFIQLVCNWHNACDMRGASADHRVATLYEFYKFLTHDIKFHGYPSQFTSHYYKGMPLHTYEAILQNVTTRIQLYSYTHNWTYNPHAISTLANESFFSDLKKLDKESTYYPKACNIPHLLGKVVTLNYFKHKPHKSYILLADNIERHISSTHFGYKWWRYNWRGLMLHLQEPLLW